MTTEIENNEGSEFGKGYAYCLGLFLAHADRPVYKHSDGVEDYGLWFNGAGDHIDEFQAKTERDNIFKEKVIRWRLEQPTKKDFQWAIQEAKDLLIEFDKNNGIDTAKGSWE